MQIDTQASKKLPQKSFSISEAAPSPLIPEMLKETPELPERKIKSDNLLVSDPCSRKNDSDNIEGEPEACQSLSESNQQVEDMECSSSEEEDESDYSDEDEDPSIEMIEYNLPENKPSKCCDPRDKQQNQCNKSSEKKPKIKDLSDEQIEIFLKHASENEKLQFFMRRAAEISE